MVVYRHMSYYRKKYARARVIFQKLKELKEPEG